MVEKVAHECAWHSLLSKMFACSVHLDHKGDSWGGRTCQSGNYTAPEMGYTLCHSLSSCICVHPGCVDLLAIVE